MTDNVNQNSARYLKKVLIKTTMVTQIIGNPTSSIYLLNKIEITLKIRVITYVIPVKYLESYYKKGG